MDYAEDSSDQKAKKKKKAKKVAKASVDVAMDFDEMLDDAAEQTRFRRASKLNKDADRGSELSDSFVQQAAVTARSNRLSLLAEEEEKSSD